MLLQKAAAAAAASDQTVNPAHKIRNLCRHTSGRKGACSTSDRSTERAYAPSTMVIGQGKSGSLIFVKMRSEKSEKRPLTRDRSPERRTPNDLTKVSTRLEKDDVEQPSRLPCRMQRLRRCLRYLHRLMSQVRSGSGHDAMHRAHARLRSPLPPRGKLYCAQKQLRQAALFALRGGMRKLRR